MLFVMLTITPLTALLLKSAKTTTEMVWGKMPPRAGYALVLNAVMVILLMTLMGYARSSSRVHWHVYGVVRDTSPYAYSPALGSCGCDHGLVHIFLLHACRLHLLGGHDER